MATKYVFETVHNFLTDFHDNKKPFGNVIMILYVDFRHTVNSKIWHPIPNYRKYSKKSSLWTYFERCQLYDNQKLTDNNEELVMEFLTTKIKNINK